ncbi:SPW repeat protein [Sphaerobacter sp.]|mgnify:CR=1 FL=1|uniref:SPW repeat protein n=1 Tax=Sphaerobacter sp. TaxID=2099654 RepID=UPI001E0AB970|nr:SPW repeat protein [Sphaerobacter sp.]MBX5445862.1 SPW repeat protein [Sphaerobacter sp.]
MNLEMRDLDLTERLRISALIIVLVGIWLMLSPFVLSYNHLHASTWNAIAVAWVTMFIAGLRITGAGSEGWLSWLNALIGLYLIASPWIWGDADNLTLVVNNAVCGLFIVGMAAWAALSTPTLTSRA